MKKIKEFLTRKLSIKFIKNTLLVLMVLVPFLMFWVGVVVANVTAAAPQKKAKDLITPTVKPTRKISPQDKVEVRETLNENPTDRYFLYQDGNALKLLPPKSTKSLVTIDNPSENFFYNAAISSDNKNVAYIKNHSYQNPTEVRDNNVYIYNIATKQKKVFNISIPIADNSKIEWSGKNDYLILSSNQNGWNFYILNVNNTKDIKNIFGNFITFINDYEYLYSFESYYTSPVYSLIVKKDIRKTLQQSYQESPGSPIIVQDNEKKYRIYSVDANNQTIFYSASDNNDPYNSDKTKYYQIGYDGKNKKELSQLPQVDVKNELSDKIMKVLDTNIDYFPNPVIWNAIPDSKNADLIAFECIGNVDGSYSFSSNSLLLVDLSNTKKGISVLAKDFNRILDYSK